MTSAAGVVVVGGGQAGFSVVSALRGTGYGGPVTVFADERHLPYQRPPLSKKAHTDSLRAELVPESFYRERDIDLRLGESVTALDTSRPHGGHRRGCACPLRAPRAGDPRATGRCPSPAPGCPASTHCARSTTPWRSAGR
ncbi:FAD-dependent oxidoreductase [Streptomyces sp. NPDC002838]|uniref:FAD-dependent oxidoreductase n=1 Tax=Streptomyces sp. NPDC002838 TaxID=3154436 RepID=UPI0033276293